MDQGSLWSRFSLLRVFSRLFFARLVRLLDLRLGFGVDLDAFTEEHGVHAGSGVRPRGVEQQVG